MNAIRIYRQGLLVGLQEWAVFWNWKTWLFGWMVRILTSAAAWILLGDVLGSQEKVYFLLIGNVVHIGAQSATWPIAASAWDRWDGTYPLLVIAPSSLLPAIMGRTSIWLLNSIATSLLAFASLAVMFRLPLPMPGSLLAPLVVVLICISTYCMTTFMGAVVARNPRLRNIIANILSILMMTICGVSVPVTFWPGWVQFTANILPVTHGLTAVRLLLSSGGATEILKNIGLECVIGLAWFGLAVLTMDRLADAGRADGSIEFV